ncbi:haloacid dehalogenase-like hydrolase [Streptomyces sp. AV19]|uniref:HAD family hydrolase n=1 Tax=Streptomyces sp. AV19 TaxID=2793068 RepID=UPI0018FF0104|nr:haloacid dehalogenase-like hydrolase [Streptomyces sp. AV19]MBH1933220.1 haloacid dehalogenase-like hydrolase [Streptomyces sp. AV19]MDG4530680.1 haloacid dehalogenase-like hydrolase [Streptomyces sp. AV19]
MSRLHLFDLDGTLIHGSAAAVEISRQLGVEREIDALERDFAAGRLTPVGFATAACELWGGTLTNAVVAAAFDGAPWLDGIRDVWADIAARGERCAVISLSPHFFVERLLAWGADAAHGSRWPDVPLRDPVNPEGILNAGAKVRIADELCAAYGLERADCVAYGDSMSDALLFAAVPVSVAVNADHHVRDVASLSYAGRDLREAYELVGDRVR